MRTLIACLAIVASPVAAAGGAALESGTPVTVLKVDGGHDEATFLEARNDVLRLVESKPRTWGEIGPHVVEVPLQEVAAVEGPAGFRLHEERLPAFMIGGVLLGGIVGYMVRSPPHDTGILVANARGGPQTNVTLAIDGGDGHAVEGSLVGLAAGTFFGLLASHGRGPVQRWTFTPEGVATPE